MTEEITDTEALAILVGTGGMTPGSRYGRDAEACAPVALAAAKIIAAEQGVPLDREGLDGTMSLVVNDSEEIAELIVQHGPEHGIQPDALLDADTLRHATVPLLSEVEAVRIGASVEVWLTDGEGKARETLGDWLGAIRNALPEGDERRQLIDEGEEVEPSEHDSEVSCLAGQAHLTVTPQEWERIADGFCIDLGGRSLPADIVPTLGILDEHGVTPAVAIPETDHGWGYGGYEPSIIASLYVAIGLREGVQR